MTTEEKVVIDVRGPIYAHRGISTGEIASYLNTLHGMRASLENALDFIYRSLSDIVTTPKKDDDIEKVKADRVNRWMENPASQAVEYYINQVISLLVGVPAHMLRDVATYVAIMADVAIIEGKEIDNEYKELIYNTIMSIIVYQNNNS